MKKFVILTIISMFIVLLSGAIPLRGQAIWLGQYLSLQFCLFLGISFVLWQFNRFISLFTLACLLSAFFITQCSKTSMVFLIQLDLGCLACYGASKFNQENRKRILYGILGLVLLQYSWLIMQTYNLDFLFDSKITQGADELVGFSGSADQLGTFFALTLPVMLYIFPPLALLSLAGLIIAKSSFAFVAGIVSGLFYLYYSSKRLFGISILLITIVGIVFFIKVDKPTKADFSTRFSVWKYSIKAVTDENVRIIRNGKNLQVETNAWYGYGLGNYQQIIPYIPQELVEYKFNYIDEKFTHAHNDYVELFFEFGRIGAVLLIGFLGSLLLVFLKAVKTKEFILYSACVLAYLLNATGNFVSQIAVSGLLLIIFLGMLYGVRRENGKATR